MEDDEPTDEELAAWPNCATPDCEYKCCTWSGTSFCFPCAKRLLGMPELLKRYNETHERGWSKVEQEEILHDVFGVEFPPNPLREDH